ncbi:MAG: SCO family protein [Phycisphaerales bacterium JB063]
MNPTRRQSGPCRPRLLAACAVAGALVAGGLTGPASASNYNSNVESTRANPWGEELENEVGVVERLNCDLPMDLAFTDETGKAVTLGDYFAEGRPVILNIGYYRCPTVCGLVLKKLADTVGDTGLDLGDDFVVLNITIDPDETVEHAQQARDDAFGYLRDKGVEPKAEGWRFLTCDAESIKQITDATGYQYFYIKPQNEYGHPAVLVLATGDGVISRYMHGTAYDARTLRLSLVETSEGKTGSLLDRAFLTCFQYDPEANNYSATAKFIMMTAGAVTLLFVAGGMGMLFAYEKRRRSLLESKETTETNTP